MKVTDIATDNAEYFEYLVPEGALEDENILWLGAIAADGTACAALGIRMVSQRPLMGTSAFSAKRD